MHAYAQMPVGPLQLLLLAVAYEVMVTGARVWGVGGPLLRIALVTVYLVVGAVAIALRETQHLLYKLVFMVSLAMPLQWVIIRVKHMVRHALLLHCTARAAFNQISSVLSASSLAQGHEGLSCVRFLPTQTPEDAWVTEVAIFFHCLYVLLAILVWSGHILSMMPAKSPHVGLFCLYLALAVAGSVVMWLFVKMVLGLVWRALHRKFAWFPLWSVLYAASSPDALLQLLRSTAGTYLTAFLVSVLGALVPCAATRIFNLDLTLFQKDSAASCPSAAQRRSLAALVAFIAWPVLYVAWSVGVLPRVSTGVLVLGAAAATAVLVVMDQLWT